LRWGNVFKKPDKVWYGKKKYMKVNEVL